jgi:hypothetical protein
MVQIKNPGLHLKYHRNGKEQLSCIQRTGPLLSNRDSVLTLFHGNNNAENNKLYLTENKALSSFLSKQEP